MSARPTTRRSRLPAPVRGLGRMGGFVAGRILFWAPVWLPLILLVQFVVLGLAPARAESRRLDRAEASLDRYQEELHAEREALDDDRRRLGDEIWRERVRRSLHRAKGEPLTLDGRRRATEHR